MMESVLYFVEAQKNTRIFWLFRRVYSCDHIEKEGDLLHTIHSSGWAILRSSPAMQGRHEDGPPLFCCGLFPARRLCGILQKQRSI